MITCFDINERECKIACLSESKGSLFIHQTLTVDFPQTDAQDPKRIKLKGDLLRESLKQNKIKTDKTVLTVPKQSVTVRLVSLPSSDDSEITQMARFEAERHIPFNVERHIISHHVLRKEGVSGSKVLIAAVDSPLIEDAIQILRTAGIEIEAADISSLSLFNLFLASKPNLKEDVTTALIHIGNYTTDITLIRKDLVIYTRSALHGINKLLKDIDDAVKPEKKIEQSFLESFDLFFPEKAFINLSRSVRSDSAPLATEQKPAGNDEEKNLAPSAENEIKPPIIDDSKIHDGDKIFAENKLHHDDIKISLGDANSVGEFSPDIHHPSRKALQEWVNRLFQEIRRTYEFARREFECPQIQRVFLSGDVTRCQNVAEFFSKNLGVEAQLNPGINMIAPHPKIKSASLPKNLLPYAEAIGGVCRELLKDTLKINLLPKEYMDKKAFETKKRNFMWIGLFIAFAGILAFIYFKDRADYSNSMLKWFKEQNQKNEADVEKLADMDKKLKIIKKEVDDKRSAIAILEKISALSYIPSKVALTDFTYLSGDSVSIGGHALEIEDLNKFLSDLEQSGFFTSVRLKQRAPYELPYRSRKVQSFDIICMFDKKTEKKGKK